MWTIRLKLHKTTVVIAADPLKPLDEIKTELSRALKTRHPQGIITATGPTQIPSRPSDIILAKPVDVHEPEKGWERLRSDEDEDDLSMLDGANDKGKKKGATTSLSGNTLKAAGLKDGSVLAFKFRNQQGQRQDDEGIGLDESEQAWDVILPSYEDSTGVTNEGDIGGQKNYDR